MKKIIIADFVEYNYPTAKLGNYHICNQFVKNGYEVLWMSNPFNELIYFKDKSDYTFKKRISKAKRHKLAEHIYGFAPWSMRLYGNYPLSRNAAMLRHFSRYIRPNIQATLQRIGFDKVDVLWVSTPKQYWLADVVDYDKLAYRIADDYTHFKEFPNIAEVEADFIKKCDNVFVTSDLFADKATRYGKRATLLKNAVDYDYFEKAGFDIPPEYEKSKRKKVVYVGAIKYWMDQELLAKLATHSDADIFMIGPIGIDIERYKDCENLHFLGPKPYSQVASYMRNANVAIIPFLTGDLTAAISPLKLFEYCAVGTPVVSSSMEEVKRLKAPIIVADNHKSFIKGVNDYLNSNTVGEALIDYAKKSSWQDRFNVIMEALYGE